jgi:hypothetical protein
LKKISNIQQIYNVTYDNIIYNNLFDDLFEIVYSTHIQNKPYRSSNNTLVQIIYKFFDCLYNKGIWHELKILVISYKETYKEKKTIIDIIDVCIELYTEDFNMEKSFKNIKECGCNCIDKTIITNRQLITDTYIELDTKYYNENTIIDKFRKLNLLNDKPKTYIDFILNFNDINIQENINMESSVIFKQPNLQQPNLQQPNLQKLNLQQPNLHKSEQLLSQMNILDSVYINPKNNNCIATNAYTLYKKNISIKKYNVVFNSILIKSFFNSTINKLLSIINYNINIDKKNEIIAKLKNINKNINDLYIISDTFTFDLTNE